jgi:transglutaminase-like putative cysteine protease
MNNVTNGNAVTLTITHRTVYRYAMPVEIAQHQAVIRPLACPWQQILAHHERIDPEPSYMRSRIDAFGNEVLYFSLERPHDTLEMVSETTVQLQPRWRMLNPYATPPWEEVVHGLRFHVGGGFPAESEFCFPSPYIGRSAALRDYALPSFAPGAPVLAGAINLMHRIHADFAYLPASTTFDTPALTAFELRRGVCQDFAQVMIGCLRSLGLPARYVSGYLRNDPPPGHPKLVGADASHAWLSVHCPGQGWVDLDPTNDVLADVDHVTLAVGRDYSDVSLLRGVLLGGGAHQIEVAVNVHSLS